MGREFRFGLFTLDAERGELRREGVLVRLQAQPVEVLAYLVEHAGQVASREELRKAIWGETTFVDFDAGLNFCVSQIRTALQDDSAQPRYIRTVPKSGYQFIAPAERLSPDTDNPTELSPGETSAKQAAAQAHGMPVMSDESLPLQQTARRGKMWWIVAGCTLAFALAGASVLLIVLYLTPSEVRYAASPPIPILAVARFDNETGDAALDRFADALADTVVEQLTVKNSGSYRVIGNAQILRVSREQRDLQAIRTTLGAGYAVLGQVRGDGSQLRILAHLIRLSDQTHIWVVRLDRPRGDELKLEADIAAQIATEFASRMAQQPENAPSFAPRSH